MEILKCEKHLKQVTIRGTILIEKVNSFKLNHQKKTPAANWGFHLG
jgi:hypothetical protein